MADNETLTLPAEAKAAIESIRSMKTSTDALTAENEALRNRLAAVEGKLAASSLSLPGSEDYTKKYSVTRVARALFTGNPDDAPFEREISDQTLKRLPDIVKQRVMTTVTPSAGGFLIPTEMQATLLPKFDSQAIVNQIGATVLKPSGWPYKINSITGGLTAAYAAEGGAGSASDLTFAQLNLSPRKMTARTFVTAEQVGYGTPQTDSVILDDISLRLALLRDYWALIGTGSSMPLGLFNYSAAASPTAQQIATVAGVTSGTLRFIDFAAALKKLESINVGIDGATLVCHSDLKWEMFADFNITVASGTLANQGAALWMPTGIASPQKFKELTGYNLATSTQLPTTTALVGNFKDLFIAEWGGVVLTKSDVASDGTNHAFTMDGVHLKGTLWTDMGAARPNAFCTITGV